MAIKSESPHRAPIPHPPKVGAARVALTRERIELEALALIDEEGLAAFSTRKLGHRLGCEAMSIYHHFPSKAHILDALVDRVLSSMAIPDRAHSPEQRVREFAHTWRSAARAHPHFYQWLSLHRWNSQAGIGFLGELLACFRDAGLSTEIAARAFRVLGYYMIGATLDETSGYAQGTSSLQPLTQEALLRDYPLVAQAGVYFSPEHFDRTFEMGLDLFLDTLGMRSAASPS